MLYCVVNQFWCEYICASLNILVTNTNNPGRNINNSVCEFEYLKEDWKPVRYLNCYDSWELFVEINTCCWKIYNMLIGCATFCLKGKIEETVCRTLIVIAAIHVSLKDTAIVTHCHIAFSWTVRLNLTTQTNNNSGL